MCQWCSTLKFLGLAKKGLFHETWTELDFEVLKIKIHTVQQFGIISPRPSGFEHKIYILRQSSKSFQLGFIVLQIKTYTLRQYGNSSQLGFEV